MPPNVLLVVMDQQRPDLTRGYVACRISTLNLASRVSGQFPSRHGCLGRRRQGAGGRAAWLVDRHAHVGVRRHADRTPARVVPAFSITDSNRLSIHSDTTHGVTEYELYDLKEDPNELESLADDESSQRLLNEIVGEAWRESTATKAPWPERISRA